MKDSGEFRVSLSLIVGSDDLAVRKLHLTPSHPIAVGRSSKAAAKRLLPAGDNAHINNPVISRHHAELKSYVAPGDTDYSVHVEDKGSMHGTFVNKVKVITNLDQQLFNKDVVRFGADVTRGNEIFKAPEFLVTIEKHNEHTSSASTHSQSDSLLDSGLRSKDGFYVPEYESSPSPSIIDADYDSDSARDDESNSSAPALDEHPLTDKPGTIPLPDVFEVSARKLEEPNEIIDIDCDTDIQVIDEIPNDIDEFDIDYDCDNFDYVPPEGEGEDYEDDEDVDGFGESSDDESDDHLSRVDSAEWDSSRESSADSEAATGVHLAPQPPNQPLVSQKVSEAVLREPSTFDMLSYISERPIQDCIQNDAPAPVRKLEIDDLLNAYTPRPEVANSQEMAPSRHVSHIFDNPTSDEICSSSAAPIMGTSSSLEPHTSESLFKKLAAQETLSGPSQSSVRPVASTAREIPSEPMHPEPFQAYNPWADHGQVSFNATAKPPPYNFNSSLKMDTPKKRPFDLFVQDLLDLESRRQAPQQPASESSLSFECPPSNIIEYGLLNRSQGPEKAAVPQPDSQTSSDSVADLLSIEAQPESLETPPEVKLNSTSEERPSKRPRLQGVVKTAGTVLASAVAGGVATFYALGLTPESFFT